MDISQPVCLVPAGDICGEGAVWCAAERAVYWTDINRFLIHRYDTEAGTTRSWLFDEPVVALSLTTDASRLLVGLGSKLVWWWPATDRRQDHGFRLAGAPGVRINDGRADPRGDFWLGSMRNNVLPNGDGTDAGGTEGRVFRVTSDGGSEIFLRDIGISNTMCWSPDHRYFYTADTLADVIWRCDYDAAAGTISNRRIFFANHGRGMPDGSVVDAEGYLWNCRFFGRSIVRLSPEGKIDRVIEMPVKNITTACFGGPEMKTLFVTSAANLRDPGDRLAGSLWAIETGVRGLGENAVRV